MKVIHGVVDTGTGPEPYRVIMGEKKVGPDFENLDIANAYYASEIDHVLKSADRHMLCPARMMREVLVIFDAIFTQFGLRHIPLAVKVQKAIAAFDDSGAR